VLAAVSLANMAAMALPEAVATVIVGADNDAPGSKAAASLERAVAAFQGQGRSVRVARGPAGRDLNDLLRGVG